MRNNRPDTRPNEKKRRAISKQVEDQKTIQDLRVTRKKKAERAEREVLVGELRSDKSSREKHVRSLRKKLRHIDELIKIEANGGELDAQQRAKVDSLDSLLSQMQEITALE